MQPRSCQLCHQPAPSPPFAELVSNPTPSGQVSRDRVSPPCDQLARELYVQEFCKQPSLICEADRAAYTLVRRLRSIMAAPFSGQVGKGAHHQ
jgi:hypothetical protein